MRTLAILFAVAAVSCLVVATAGMVTGRPGARAGWMLRALAIVCFALTVALNLAAH